MGNWKFFIIGIACFMVYRLLHNLYKLIAIKKLFSVYLEYLDNPQFSFHQKISRIVKLFNNAEIEDFVIYKIKPEGAGYVRDIQTTGFSNITFIDPEVVPQIKGKFHEAIGVFKARVLE